MQVGELRIDPVIDGEGRFAPTKTFRTTSPEAWAAHQDLLGEDGKLGYTMGSFLVRGLGRTVLVDLGVGRATLLGITGGALLDSLATYGVAPEDVTDVVFTHLHADHIGWASVDGAVTFPNATHRFDAADWHHFVEAQPDGPEAAVLRPIAERVEPWTGSQPVLPGLDALAAPGHTPGSSVLVLSSGADRAVLLGDVVHCPVQLLDDDWAGLFDVDPELARRTRRRVALELEGGELPAAGAHFEGLHFGRVVRAEGRRRWVV